MTDESIWHYPTRQRMEYPPLHELVWAEVGGRVIKARYHWEPGMPMPGGEWTDEAGAPVADVARWSGEKPTD